MAERSAEERINLWYQQFAHALKMSRDDFYRNATDITLGGKYHYPVLSVAEQVQRFQDATETLRARVTYLQQNPAEVVQDRSDRLAEQAREALQNAPVRDYWAELTPEERRIDEAIARVTDPEYLGQQAEERFYAEQDPTSDWYREDLYHGEPGPDVAADWADAHGRELAQAHPDYWEPTEAEQRAYEDAVYDRLEEQAQGDEPYEQTRAALGERLFEVQELLQEVHPQSAEAMALRVERFELRETLARLEARVAADWANEHGDIDPALPGQARAEEQSLPATVDRFEWAQDQAYRDGGLGTLTHISIDTSDPDLGASW